MGSEVQVLAKHGGDDVIVLFRERFQPAPGERLTLTPDPAHIHLFDAETGRALRV
jgi:multiple sugar transport system ATP-binding protein